MVKVQAATRLKATEEQTFTLEVSCSPSAYAKLINLLGAIQYNTAVGHSCQIGAYFDGDGADKVAFEGLPDNLGRDMADACANYGDDLFALIDDETALVYNQRYGATEDERLFKTMEVYPVMPTGGYCPQCGREGKEQIGDTIVCASGHSNHSEHMLSSPNSHSYE
jgi:hypothetical protein